VAGHHHTATVAWRRGEGDFGKGRYSRAHVWRFDGGVEVPGSASPSVVPLPFSKAEAVDPEEAFVAALSSCHMLTFIDVARRAGFVIDAYEDEAVGTMTKNERGALWVSEVVLRPKITFAGDRRPTQEELDHLHHEAHDQCFIANSVKTDVRIEMPVEADR
jgi:organic hydroperoxide reductase OsmC/OhrA